MDHGNRVPTTHSGEMESMIRYKTQVTWIWWRMRMDDGGRFCWVVDQCDEVMSGRIRC